jgi:23S rRNA pseudouridine1911/1915/1917 synthase
MRMSSTEAGPNIDLLYIDEHLCVAWKPTGMPVQPDVTGDPSLLAVLTSQLGDAGMGLAHRLDRPVSGAVLLSRSHAVLQDLNKQFRSRLVSKVYWAIVEGTLPPAEAGVERSLEHILTRDGRSRRAQVQEMAGQQGPVSRTFFRVLAQGERLALLEVRPEGGAFHQIRAQLASYGYPIRGDVKYGARRGERDRSIALHARNITFVHPVFGEPISIEAPIPTTPIWRTMTTLADLHG